jgi:predicted DNA-binding WGR domain protein
MKPVYLERHDPDKNLHRFYQLFITPGIFGDWSLVKEWGTKIMRSQTEKRLSSHFVYELVIAGIL